MHKEHCLSRTLHYLPRGQQGVADVSLPSTHLILGLVYPSSALGMGEEELGGALRMVGQANSVPCSSALGSGSRWSTAVGKTQLNRASFSRHCTDCSSLPGSWGKNKESKSVFVSALFPARSAFACPCCALPRGCYGQGVLIPTGSSTTGSIRLVNKSHQLSASCSPGHGCAPSRGRNALGLHPSQSDCWWHLFRSWLFSVVLGDLEGKALKQKPWWPFEKLISLFPCSK